ncbi:MAG: SpoIIE family protein phosphatase [Planctomycetota bacterium]
MTKTIPHYLRIHRDSASLSGGENTPIIDDPVNHFWSAYADATGWRIDQKTSTPDAMQLLPAVNPNTFEQERDVLSNNDSTASSVGKSAAMRLAESASILAEELNHNREAMRRQEAELATRAPLLGGSLDCQRIADRIEKTLADASAACHCDAAALYMLDDDTQSLKTRSVFGLPPKRLEMAARPLRGSRGDLEALVQGVVLMDELKPAPPMPIWNSPEKAFRSGICTSVQCDDIPIGTMWLFSKEARSFGIAEASAARMASSHLSLELTYASLPDVESRRSSAGPMTDIANWQFESLPIGTKLAPEWRVDGMVESPRSWAGGWHTWDVLPDGTLMLALAESSDPTAKGAMVSAVARAAMTAHTGYQHTPAQVLQRVSDTLWQTSTGEQLISLLYARVDPETGDGEIASAGSIQAMIGSRYGYRPVADGLSEPLNTHLDPQIETESFRVNLDETFLAYTAGMTDDGASQISLGEQLRSSMALKDSNPLAMIRRSMANMPLKHERGAVTLLRS